VTWLPDEPVTLGRATGPHGEVLLRRRGDVEELVVNGVFAMDSSETRTERELARLAAGAARVLVGGLGLGYTAAELLAGDVAVLDVVELEDCLVGWAARGLTPTLDRVARDPRVRLWTADVAAVLDGRTDRPPGPWDAVLLDVDNGPDFLIHDGNAALYAEPALRAAYARLAPGGVLALWSQGRSPALLATLAGLGGAVDEHTFAVRREGRDLEYAVYTVREE
jgi:spermidine synthase